MRRFRTLLAVTAIVGAGLAVMTASSDTRAGAADTALLRVAHLSPDTPGVDVWVDGKRALGNVGFQAVSNYLAVPAGKHLLELRPAGASASSPPALHAEATLAAGHAYTAAGLGSRASLHAGLFEDDLSAPPAGEAKVRVIDAAVGLKAVDVKATSGAVDFASVPFGTAVRYKPTAPGTYALVLSAAGAQTQNASTAPAVEFAPGIVYTVAAIGGAQHPLRLLTIVDARASAQAPQGGVQTGGGGTAPVPSSPWWPLAGLVAAAIVISWRVRTASR
jgi:hypothetical protein